MEKLHVMAFRAVSTVFTTLMVLQLNFAVAQMIFAIKQHQGH
jgi:hypothetical protein